MNASLVQTRKNKFATFVDVMMTLFAWTAFLILLIGGIDLDVTAEHSIYIKSSWPQALITLCIYFLFMILFCLILIGWAKYNHIRCRVERRSRQESLSKRQLMQTFAMKERDWDDLQLAKVAIVHHDDKAKVIEIDVRDALIKPVRCAGRLQPRCVQ